MPEGPPLLPELLAPERFFGRVEDLAALRREARALARGIGRSRILCARPGAGKTQLLRQWHERLFGEGEILPLWFSVPAGAVAPAALARRMLAAFAIQALAFRRREPALLSRRLSRSDLAEGLRSSWGHGGVLLAEALGAADSPESEDGAFAAAAASPLRLAQASGTKVLCFIDDAGNLDGAPAGLPWPEAALASPASAALFAVEGEEGLHRLFGPNVAAVATLERLAPLTAEAASRLARQLARSAGLELDEASVAALAGEAAGSPFYVGALVRALAARTGTGPLEVARAAAAAVCDGELARYWSERLAAANPERRVRATALEILTYCLREPGTAQDPSRLAGAMLKPEGDVEAALAGLARAGVVSVDCASVRVDEDPVLRDVVRAHYRREFGRVPAAAVTAALAAEKVRQAPSLRQRARRERLRAALRALLEAWSGQSVPAALFDAAAFQKLAGAEAADAALAAPDAPAASVVLPRIVSCAAGRVGGSLSLPDPEFDALAWGLRGAPEEADADVAWIARVIGGGPGVAERLERFDRDVVALQTAGELPAVRVVRWAVLEAPPDAAAERAAARLRLATSAPRQLEALAGLLGVAIDLPAPERAGAAAPELELEMVIPRAADVELIAARALEQLAENLALDAQAIGRLKVALVEACINAFEHSGAEDGRVRLVFSVGGGRLLMRVENRGRALTGLPARAVAGREARGRGWGLTLIRELVDEVALEPREDGVSLLMVKHLARENHG